MELSMVHAGRDVVERRPARRAVHAEAGAVLLEDRREDAAHGALLGPDLDPVLLTVPGIAPVPLRSVVEVVGEIVPGRLALQLPILVDDPVPRDDAAQPRVAQVRVNPVQPVVHVGDDAEAEQVVADAAPRRGLDAREVFHGSGEQLESSLRLLAAAPTSALLDRHHHFSSFGARSASSFTESSASTSRSRNRSTSTGSWAGTTRRSYGGCLGGLLLTYRMSRKPDFPNDGAQALLTALLNWLPSEQRRGGELNPAGRARTGRARKLG